MTIQSMTGFARTDGARGLVRWHWEVRSVNNRGLDVRVRLPPGYESLEPRIRDRVAKCMSRGSVAVNLSVNREAVQSVVRINETALEQVVAAAKQVRNLLGAPPPSAEGLLALKGVLEVVDEPEGDEEVAATHVAMLGGLTGAIEGVVAARSAEGARLKAILASQVEEIARLAGLIEAAPARTPEAIGRRLAEQVGRLVETGQGLDPARLHQEAVLMATRGDVEEELQRLKAHVAGARELLVEPGAVGRRLDFLAQEFAREANTLTSKAADADLARLGLALKAVIDQMREQVQNIE